MLSVINVTSIGFNFVIKFSINDDIDKVVNIDKNIIILTL